MPLRYTGNCEITENEAMLQSGYGLFQECYKSIGDFLKNQL